MPIIKKVPPRRGDFPIRYCSQQSDVFVMLFVFGNLTIRFISGDAIALLDLANELIALALDLRPIAVGQLTPFLFCLPGELLPVTFDTIPVHYYLRWIALWMPTHGTDGS